MVTLAPKEKEACTGFTQVYNRTKLLTEPSKNINVWSLAWFNFKFILSFYWIIIRGCLKAYMLQFVNTTTEKMEGAVMLHHSFKHQVFSQIAWKKRAVN